MKNFKIAIEQCLEHENYYGALFIALSLPDICAKLESPDKISGSRYSEWFDKYIGEKYIVTVSPKQNKRVFLTGNDCYALKCSLLHEGGNDISEKKKKETLEKFKFLIPPRGIVIHNYFKDGTLQLQVELFCRDILEGVEKWEEHIKDKEQIQEKMKDLLMIAFLKDTALNL